MPPPLTPISGLIPPDHYQQIEHLAGDGGISAGLRTVVAAGLAALGGDDPVILGAADDLIRLADRMAVICGRRTPAGAWWAPGGCEAMPAPELLAAGGDVVAAPGLVVIARPGYGAMSWCSDTGRIELQVAGRFASVSHVEPGELARIAAALPMALISLAAAGPGRRELGLGLAIERTAGDWLQISLGELSLAVVPGVAWLLAAELLALAARRMDAAIELRAALDRQLEVSP